MKFTEVLKTKTEEHYNYFVKLKTSDVLKTKTKQHYKYFLKLKSSDGLKTTSTMTKKPFFKNASICECDLHAINNDHLKKLSDNFNELCL